MSEQNQETLQLIAIANRIEAKYSEQADRLREIAAALSRPAAASSAEATAAKDAGQGAGEWPLEVQWRVTRLQAIVTHGGYEELSQTIVAALRSKQEDTERLELAREALSDWRSKKLSDGAALFAISIALTPQSKPTPSDIAKAKSLAAMSQARQKGEG